MTPALAAAAVGCPVCRNALPPENWNLDYETYCPVCRAPVSAVVFPALFRGDTRAFAEVAVQGTEATCFYHATKKAVAPCDQCGRFLCSLCQVELSGQNWCPSCLESHRSQGKLATLEKARTMYDNIALVLAMAPATIVLWFMTIFTAPAALFVILRYWRKPLSVTPRTKVRFVIAGILALLELVGLVFLIGAIVMQARRAAVR
jgi:hypothetical protein